MAIVFEEITGEVAPRAGASDSGIETAAPAPAAQNDMREQLLRELSVLRERQARLFAD